MLDLHIFITKQFPAFYFAIRSLVVVILITELATFQQFISIEHSIINCFANSLLVASFMRA